MSPSRQLGGCKLERVLSHSEHSELYRAFSEELQRRVMIKVLSARYPPNSRTAKRFRRGGELAVELEHPNIVRTFSAGEDRGRPYMLMEFVDGHGLDRILKVKNRISWEMAVGIVRQVAKALEAAGQKSIVHRHIEPSHIMLSPGGCVRVLGFGLARLSEPSDAAITAEGALVNVSPYSAPEMGEGIQDIRGDLYSLGCVFYHLLSGSPPFDGTEPLELLRQHRTGVVWPIHDLVPDVPDAIGEVVAMLLAKDAGARIQTPRELIGVLDAAVNPDVLGAQGLRPDKTILASTIQMLALRQEMTVLVCDDQEATLTGLRETLRRLGVNPLTTRDGRTAVETLANRDVNLIVTDIKLPGLWGKGLLTELARTKPSVPMVLTRRGPLAESLYKEPEFHVKACLDRPLDLFALRRTVQSLIQ